MSTVLILGPSGKIGTHAARAFAASGWEVRNYKRGTDMTEAAQGVDVIVNGLNPPNYANWEENIPRITNQVIAAAKASGATVIIPGNVYIYGDHPGLWDETTPQRATTKKGKIRVTMEKTYRDSGVQTIILRAGNFIDPDGNADVFTVALMRSIRKGKITLMGRPDVPQSYCYLPDWARAAVSLAEMRGQLSRFEDIPFPGHTFTIDELRDGLETITGRKLSYTAFPWWIMTLSAPFWELARELKEMRHLWNLGHQLSGRKFASLLPDFTETPFEQVIGCALPEASPKAEAITA